MVVWLCETMHLLCALLSECTYLVIQRYEIGETWVAVAGPYACCLLTKSVVGGPAHLQSASLPHPILLLGDAEWKERVHHLGVMVRHTGWGSSCSSVELALAVAETPLPLSRALAYVVVLLPSVAFET